MTRTLSATTSRQLNEHATGCTVIRPRPDRRGAGSAAVKPRVNALVHQALAVPADEDAFFSSLGPNPLLSEAWALLALASHVKTVLHHPDPAGLYRQLVAQIQGFEAAVQKQRCTTGTVKTASYWLCALLDESVLQTPWGAQCKWQRHALLLRFHRHDNAAHKPLERLSQITRSDSPDLALLEFCYVCLSIGFDGRSHRLAEHSKIDALRDEIYKAIRVRQPSAEDELCERWQGLGLRKKSCRLPLWVAASVFVAVAGAGHLALSQWAAHQSEPVMRQLQELHSFKSPPQS